MLSKGVQKIKISKRFHEICVQIGECKSREEEESIVGKWMESVKDTLKNPKIKLSQLYENVISLIHLTLLGYDTSFGHIHAVNLTQDSQMMTKALGYLACSAILDSKSSLLILIINSTQRDLSSQHPTSMALALTAICHLVTPDLIPPIIGYVGQCLTHSIPLIRQKAIMCIHSFIQKDPSCVIEFFPELVRMLNDPDISIINAIINTFSTLLKSTLNIRQICEVLPDVTNIVQLIQQGQAKTEYYHQKTLAPFVLVNMFSLFQRMAPHMPEIGNEVAPLITFALQNGSKDCSAAGSVLYEAIRTSIALGLTDIPQLKTAINLFMDSNDQNYIYIGLGLLSSFPDFADEFQTTIIDCLDHPDSTIRLRTLGLLHAMANENNAQIIVVNMLKFFQKTKNENVRIELADRITSIASTYSPSPIWFAKTMEQLFALGGENVRPEVAFAVMRLIEENCDEEMRRGIVNLYIDVAQSGRRLSDVFIIVIAKVIGQYADLSDEYDLDFVALLLCDLADGYESPRDWVLNALLAVVSKLEEVPQQVSDVFENYKQSKSIIVQEICFEALSLLQFKDVLAAAVQTELEFKDASSPYDQELAFLDDFVADQIENHGAREYIPLDARDTDIITPTSQKQLKFTYNQNVQNVYGDYPEGSVGAAGSVAKKGDDNENALDLTGVKMIWGEQGVTDEFENRQEDVYGEPSKEQPKQMSMFERLKIAKAPAPTQEESQKKKMAKSLFSGTKKSTPTPTANPNSASMSVNSFQQQQPTSTLLAAASSPQVYGSTGKIQLTEEDYQKLEYIKSEIHAPLPGQIEQFVSAFGEPVLCYEDSQMKCSALAINGSLLLVVTNSNPSNPMMKLNVNIKGPEALQRQLLTHPAAITAIPPLESVFFLDSYKFPQSMHGFPDFVFSCAIQYNNDRKAAFNLPMNLTSFIGPMQLTTPQFGQLWKQGGSEMVLSIPRTDPNVTIDYLSHLMNAVVHVKTVERIGAEEIFCGNLISTPFKVLIHVKFGSENFDIKILTKAQALTQTLYNFVKQNLFA